ncbi:erythromycin esterase-like protein [Prauserella shujinwangii]|uniref:Erythromycin esterase-like protein n=1 Tax=Prauserella shujinwangii TaxID=1453103 RepID=A0A2T0LR55_9PSEU|nr:erythromycin esterase family protein [Prauserella shujinwangii]PRX45954.1 erythromycin esterase-like protein [Prauserella shujinwangii]
MENDVARARQDAVPLRSPQDLDPVLERVGAARYVLIGEASHGTAEFYRWRAELTKRLIDERGFSFVAVEGDWPDCHRVHCCVTGAPGAPNDPRQVLWGFRRWPTWMWANEDVADFAGWLRGFNTARPGGPPVGFHGLDVYSLWDSLRDILDYLREHEPDQVEAAMEAYHCFEPHHEDPASYARSAASLVPSSCEEEVVRLLAGLRSKAAGSATEGLDPAFVAAQNAEIVAGAERYYREMVRGGARSWNVRDEHMTDTLDRLVAAYGPDAKAVVWAHNTHIGDARATSMASAGMFNVGQLVRERHAGDGVVAVGFGTHSGTVLASGFWGGPVSRMPVPEARPGTTEALLHEAVPDRDSLFVLDGDRAPGWASAVRGHRAIGVVYDPELGRVGGDVPTVLGDRYDVFVHCDRTDALAPLHPWEPEAGEPETYPFGE